MLSSLTIQKGYTAFLHEKDMWGLNSPHTPYYQRTAVQYEPREFSCSFNSVGSSIDIFKVQNLHLVLIYR